MQRNVTSIGRRIGRNDSGKGQIGVQAKAVYEVVKTQLLLRYFLVVQCWTVLLALK
jgi:hypothetical protein